MNNYKDLKVWQKAIDLTTKVYEVVNCFPDKERFGLISQITRSAVSVPSNIAEGSGWNSSKEFNQFLGIALGSCYELETQMLIAKNIGYLNEEKYQELSEDLIEIQKMISGLKKSLNK